MTCSNISKSAHFNVVCWYFWFPQARHSKQHTTHTHFSITQYLPQNQITHSLSIYTYIFQTHRVSGDNKGWVDVLTVPFFASNASAYISISPLRDGAAGLFKHLVHVQIAKKRIIPLTHGMFEVNQIVYWDELNEYV